MSTVMNRNLQIMLDEIREEARETSGYTGRSTFDERVMEILSKVPRHDFVPDDLLFSAYANRPLPIGHGQTISQPYIVALMTDLIQPRTQDVVLEIGTGSGYQTAVLASLVKQVYSLEIVEKLADSASRRLQRMGYRNVEVRVGNGHFGWPEHAPYDAIIVTAAARHVPSALIAQLKPGGRLLIPVGSQYAGQELRMISKDEAGRLDEKAVLPVIFVPLTGGD